jgi:acyl carrier protein
MTTPSARKIEERIRAFLLETLPARAAEIAALGLDTQIWEVVGSLELLELVEYLEGEFKIKVHPLEFVPENFSSLRAIIEFTERRLEGSPPA